MVLLNNQMSYPTVVFLNEEFAIIQPLPGYQKPEEFHKGDFVYRRRFLQEDELGRLSECLQVAVYSRHQRWFRTPDIPRSSLGKRT